MLRWIALAPLALAVPVVASPAPEVPTPALVVGCGVHIQGPLTIRDAETGVVLLAVPARDSLDTDCAVTTAPLVFDGSSHRAIVTHH